MADALQAIDTLHAQHAQQNDAKLGASDDATQFCCVLIPFLPSAEELTQLLHHMARWGSNPNKHVVVLAQLTNAPVFVEALQVAAEYGIQVWFAVFPTGDGAGSCASAAAVASSLQEWAMEATAVQGVLMTHVLQSA